MLATLWSPHGSPSWANEYSGALLETPFPPKRLLLALGLLLIAFAAPARVFALLLAPLTFPFGNLSIPLGVGLLRRLKGDISRGGSLLAGVTSGAFGVPGPNDPVKRVLDHSRRSRKQWLSKFIGKSAE